jgi:hypothetical protein
VDNMLLPTSPKGGRSTTNATYPSSSAGTLVNVVGTPTTLLTYGFPTSGVFVNIHGGRVDGANNSSVFVISYAAYISSYLHPFIKGELTGGGDGIGWCIYLPITLPTGYLFGTLSSGNRGCYMEAVAYHSTGLIYALSYDRYMDGYTWTGATVVGTSDIGTSGSYGNYAQSATSTGITSSPHRWHLMALANLGIDDASKTQHQINCQKWAAGSSSNEVDDPILTNWNYCVETDERSLSFNFPAMAFKYGSNNESGNVWYKNVACSDATPDVNASSQQNCWHNFRVLT